MSAPSRLLLLPAEIRTVIYSYIFLSTWIDVNLCSRAIGDDDSPRNLVIFPYLEYEQSYSVLFTCRTIYAEVLPLFKRSIWIHFRDFALPTDLPRAIQRNYFCHIQVLRLSYQADIPYDLSSFVCLQELTLETEEAVESQDVCRVLRWHQAPTAEESGNWIEQYKESNERRLNGLARSQLLREDTWLSVLFNDPARKFKIIIDWVMVDVNTSDEGEMTMVRMHAAKALPLY